MKKILLQLAITILVSVAFFSLTKPDSLPVTLLMVPILLAFALGYLFSRLVLILIGRSFISPRKQITYALLVGILVALIMLFQSTGGIVLADMIIMALIVIIAYFYINKM